MNHKRIHPTTLLFLLFCCFGTASIIWLFLPYLEYWLVLVEAVDIQLAYSNVRIGRYAYVLLHEAATGLVTILWVGVRKQVGLFVLAGLAPLAIGLVGLLWTKPWQRIEGLINER